MKTRRGGFEVVGSIVLGGILWTFGAPALGQDSVTHELEMLKERLNAQESRIAELEGKSGGTSSRFPVTFSGFLKADFFWQDARLNSTDAPRFAVLEPAGVGDDNSFSSTVQHTRMIAKWDGPHAGGGKVDGYVEVDFFNLGNSGDAKFNNTQLRTRQIYIDYTFDSWAIRAGQAWDLFSPLNGAILKTNSNGWFGGNAGFRRPQLRLTTWGDMGECKITTALSVNANIGRTLAGDPNNPGRAVNTGEDAGIPLIMASIAVAFDFLTDKPTTIGISGVIGEEEFDGVESEIAQSGFGAHLTMPVNDWLHVKGEVQHGKNTDAFLMGGGFNLTTGDEIESTSGWLQAKITPPDTAVTVFLTYGNERTSKSNQAPTGRERNEVISAAVKYAFSDALSTGLEYTYYDTEFVNGMDADASLVWSSIIFSF